MRSAQIGYETAVHDRGDGPAVVLVHGTPLDAGSWRLIAPALAQAGRRVLAYDLRGHGSAAPTPLPPDYALLAADLGRLLDLLAIERAHVVGHSFGAQVAQTFALELPERLASLTIVCGRLAPFPPFEQVAARVEADGIEPLAEGLMERWLGAGHVAAGGAAIDYVRATLARADAAAYATALRMIASYDGQQRMAEIAAPVTVIACERDGVATPELAREAAALAPSGRFELVADCGHMLPLEQPEHLLGLLDGMLPRA
ncbi:alpha/beta fold hydrolase [Conexibacter sp. JD483]|uniref:alpha/beta fold hydrolase n=1 Tax=unclassified Conexibacter TaxID=2627773 RepID=UPI0027183221|nr:MULTISPECIES: alpha/beta fold hydrolase [unclassified Conexibacter]MDO8184574.1 alpha/beta fold hydrolase [Conexibacter sp. CPCC 205706]MDO8197880.1 alpha/beta fold hydrolase [Conexibacter sp. CPCC 205762]MDR9370074.1 alpha/beta fold hydrolase [Conexibacter sp. JD483]